MSAPAQRRAEALFYEALALDPAERVAFLDVQCAADPACRAEVEELLWASDDAGGFLAPDAAVSPALEGEFMRLKPEEMGDRIGPYKLLEQIGEGGFGAVWVAEQEKPIRRRVALKIIKLGMDTKDVVARFEQERQALAMMDHPNIAKVHDAGATPLGRPFFVMELVRGVKITEYCDRENLPTAERLRLFIAVCQAVQHAHQKGIIHRDLKPSNILVSLHDGLPVPKGGRYVPSTNSWTALPNTGAPGARRSHTAEWTGSEMIVWGGYDANGKLYTGGRYNPVGNFWSEVIPFGAPPASDSSNHSAVWTGSEMSVWVNDSLSINDNYSYTPE